MRTLDQSERLSALIDHLIQRDFPVAVHLANEPGSPSEAGGTLLPYPRFSICLSGKASYQVMRNGAPSKVTLKRGEAIAVAPDCLMEPHTDGSYRALGVVFTGEMTRFLMAKKVPGKHKGAHEFLLTHHSEETLDDDTARLFEMLCRPSSRSPDDLILRRLLQLILIKARELSDASATDAANRKSWFTWRSACQFIQENLTRPIDRNTIASFLQVHPNHLSRLFTQFSGGTLSQYLLDARLRHATLMLRNPTLNINEVAQASGFTDANYFIRCFRKHHGISPGEFRKTNHS